jgi:hypothetical protein
LQAEERQETPAREEILKDEEKVGALLGPDGAAHDLDGKGIGMTRRHGQCGRTLRLRSPEAAARSAHIGAWHEGLGGGSREDQRHDGEEAT